MILVLAQFVAGLVRGATGSDILGTVAQVAIMAYAVFAALTQLGIAVQLTAPTFLIVLGAVALAAAIAFGFGAQGVARDIVEKAYDKSEETRQVTQENGPSRGTADSGAVSTARPLGSGE